MSDEHMTRAQVKELVESVVENVGLKFTNIVSEKFEEYGDKQKLEQQLARESVFETGTGVAWEKREKVKIAISYAYAAQKSAYLWKSAGILTIAGIIFKDIWQSIFPG